MQAYRNELSIYIVSESVFKEVFYISLPRFEGSHCYYSTLVKWQREQLDRALVTAKEIAERFVNDGRLNAMGEELQKAFDRALV